MGSDITYDKPFKTYSELIAIMESRNITINDYDFAKKVLSSLSYYTIVNGYKNTFLQKRGSDNFVEGTNFTDLYTLHIIDTNINNIILKHILYIERYLKTRVSYIVSQNYGVYTDVQDLTNTNSSDYLYRGYYSRSANGRNNILKRIKGTLFSNQITESVAHYTNEKNHVPAWILVTNLTFGLTIKWYGIMEPADKAAICNEFISSQILTITQKKEFMTVSLSLLHEYRNKIAHGNRTFCVANLPVLPKQTLLTLSKDALTEGEYNKGTGKNDLYAIIISCFILIDDRYILTNFLADLIYTLEPYKDSKLNNKPIYEIFNLPCDILERLQQLLLNKFTK